MSAPRALRDFLSSSAGLEIANLYVSEIDPAFERPIYRGLFYDHTSASPDNVAQMSPCFLEENGKIYMYTNVGPRLHQKIAVAVADK